MFKTISNLYYILLGEIGVVWYRGIESSYRKDIFVLKKLCKTRWIFASYHAPVRCAYPFVYFDIESSQRKTLSRKGRGLKLSHKFQGPSAGKF